jgi:hypothetical protein
LRWLTAASSGACRVEVEEDSEDSILSQKLVLIFFSHPKQIHLVQPFVAGFATIIDGTFNTNALRFAASH